MKRTAVLGLALAMTLPLGARSMEGWIGVGFGHQYSRIKVDDDAGYGKLVENATTIDVDGGNYFSEKRVFGIGYGASLVIPTREERDDRNYVDAITYSPGVNGYAAFVWRPSFGRHASFETGVGVYGSYQHGDWKTDDAADVSAQAGIYTKAEAAYDFSAHLGMRAGVALEVPCWAWYAYDGTDQHRKVDGFSFLATPFIGVRCGY